MITLDCKNEILIRFFKNKNSQRDISKNLGISRKTVRKYLNNNNELFNSTNIDKDLKKVYSVLPKYYTKNRKRLILTENIKQRIDDYLIQNQSTYNEKLYNCEIHTKLIEEGYKIGYTTICNYLRTIKEKKISIINNPKGFKPENYSWFHKLIQGSFDSNYLFIILKGSISQNDIEFLNDWIKFGNNKKRNKAISVICFKKDYSIRTISNYLLISRKTVRKYIDTYQKENIKGFVTNKVKDKKFENPEIVKSFFKIFHAPPKSYNINRTTWIQRDLKFVFEKETGIIICRTAIRKIINNAGYRLRKAKKVLTSNDTKYIEKVQNINKILAHLRPDEKFFSIDEYGPFAIKIQGGRSYVKKGEVNTYPQWQKSKGSLIITAALELSTNQVTHFYSEKKNTKEMIKLLDLLLLKYKKEKCIYFSWDAASWHASKELYEKVKEVNESNNFPKIELAPLPNCAQFLNVIESVFSGMARAIIHNSNYHSEQECKKAIDRYYKERNEHFKKYPKKAGNKIWKYERVIPKFDESNNCKDSKYER